MEHVPGGVSARHDGKSCARCLALGLAVRPFSRRCGDPQDCPYQRRTRSGIKPTSKMTTAPALTARELEIVRLIAAGKSAREIARALGLSMGTVNVHRCNMLKKTNSTKVTQLVNYVFSHGLIDQPVIAKSKVTARCACGELTRPGHRRCDSCNTAAWAKEDEKRLARICLRESVHRGVTRRTPCEVCGAAEVEAHHDDYSKPLQVRWLCRQHHIEVERLKRSRRRA